MSRFSIPIHRQTHRTLIGEYKSRHRLHLSVVSQHMPGPKDLMVDGLLANVGVGIVSFTLFVISHERCLRPCSLFD